MNGNTTKSVILAADKILATLGQVFAPFFSEKLPPCLWQEMLLSHPPSIARSRRTAYTQDGIRTNPWLPAVAALVGSDKFQSEYRLRRNSARRRRREVLGQVTEQAVLPSERHALVVLGSYARGDIAKCSDLDLALLSSGQRHPIEAPTLAGQDQGLPPVRWQFWTPDDLGGASLSLWLAASQARYLAGSQKTFRTFRSIWMSRLRSLDPRFLFRLRRGDPRRHQGFYDPSSPFRLNIKRGDGGLIDVQFVRLLHLWHCLTAEPRSLSEVDALSRRVEAVLFLAKTILHDALDFAGESAAALDPLARSQRMLTSQEVLLALQCHAFALNMVREDLES